MQTEQSKPNTGHRKKKAARACVHCQKVFQNTFKKITKLKVLIDPFKRLT